MIDSEDNEWIAQLKWQTGNLRVPYEQLAFRLSMHDLVINPQLRNAVLKLSEELHSHRSNGIVDHANRNPFDNRRSNLRYVTPRQNLLNRNKMTHKGGIPVSSKYIGVSFKKDHNTWEATVYSEQKKAHRKSFKSEIEAARWRDKEIFRLHGKFAKLNFITYGECDE